ncbi:MAG: peptidyl-prolyl cis-trans isomerase [Bacteroidota bacterium]
MYLKLPILIFIIGMLGAGLFARAGPQDPGDAVLGKAGEIFIPEGEFQQRYELLPSLRRHRRGGAEQSKTELIVALIAEKLLAQEARDRRLDRDSAFVRDFDEVRKLLARDQLYREEVTGNIVLQEEEILLGIAQAKSELLVEFLYFPEREDAEFVRRQIKVGGDFQRMALDSSLHAVRDTATVIWGDADPVLERAAYALAPGEVSEVLQAGDGSYIIQVKRIGRSSYFQALAPSVLRERVVLKIRERKERIRLQEFAESFFRDKPGFARGPMVHALTDAIHRALRNEPGMNPLFLSERVYTACRSSLASVLQDTLAVAGERVWSVEEVLKRLYARSVQFPDSDTRTIFRGVNGLLREWVLQELLAHEGLRRRLDEHPSVRRQLDMWQHASLAHAMKEHVNKSVQVGEAEVWSYIRSKDTLVQVPRVRVRELRTTTLEMMEDALSELQGRSDFAGVIARWSTDSVARETRGLSPLFPVTDRPPIGELALAMNVGERNGPVRTKEGFVFFELVEKDTVPQPGGAISTMTREQATRELLRMKQRRTLNMFLAQVGEQRGFDLYRERLARLRVTDTPMTTFRLLGFGGRMFAVPFVDPLVEWINVDPPSTTVVP